MKKQLFRLILLSAMILLLPGSSLHASEPLQVVVSIPPQLYIVQQLGGELVDAISMLPEGGLPHTYEPKPRQMKQLSNADMYVRIKVEFEDAWWDKMKDANPAMHVVDSTARIDFAEGHAHDHHDADEHHEHEGEHHHEDAEHHEHEGEQQKGEAEHHEHEAEHHEHHERDPHIWLSPRLVKIQAENIYQGLIAVDPEHKDVYTANKERFLNTLDRLDADIQAQLANLKTRTFMIFHPAWTYFARDYDLEQIPIEVEGKEPSAKEMTEFMKRAKHVQVAVIFVQPQTSRRSADTIAKHIGARVEILDPLAADWLENMRRVTNILAETLSQ